MSFKRKAAVWSKALKEFTDLPFRFVQHKLVITYPSHGRTIRICSNDFISLFYCRQKEQRRHLLLPTYLNVKKPMKVR